VSQSARVIYLGYPAHEVKEGLVDVAGLCDNTREFFAYCKYCGKPYRLVVGCNKRFEAFCEYCAARWKRRTIVRYTKAIQNMDTPKLLTLTLRKISGRFEERLKRLWPMRRRLFFYLKRRGYPIKSWVGVIEPPNHIHLVIDSRYIPQYEIVELWSRVTGDSFVVDIRRIRDKDQMAKYIAKYIGKLTKWSGMNLDAFKGFHIIGSWNIRISSVYVFKCDYCLGDHPLKLVSSYDYYAVVHYEFDAYVGTFV